MKEHHKVPVVRISDILKHPNADSLGIVQIEGYQCVVRLDSFKPGDLAVYIQPDSVVPETKPFSFLWKDRGYRESADVFGEPVPERYRRITVRKFRKEWSEGLLLPLSDFYHLLEVKNNRLITPETGTDVSELLGITHYQPPEPGESLGTSVARKPAKYSVLWVLDAFAKQFGFEIEWSYWPVTVYGWWRLGLEVAGFLPEGTVTGNLRTRGPSNHPPVYDVENFKNYKNVFEPGELVVATEKIHGSNGRFTFDGSKMHAGSRNWWKGFGSKCIWRKVLEQHPLVEEWCRAHPNYTLYGEVVPTQSGYRYGAKDGETKLFIFDVRDPKDNWVPYEQIVDDADPDQGPHVMRPLPNGEWKEYWVPIVYAGQFDEAKLKALSEGPSFVKDANHPREGIVIRSLDESKHVRGLGRAQLKIVSNAFLEKDSK